MCMCEFSCVSKEKGDGTRQERREGKEGAKESKGETKRESEGGWKKGGRDRDSRDG